VARTRPGSDRPLRFTETEDPDVPDGDADEDDEPDDRTPPTSLDDLTTEADPQQFDQTFVAGDASLTIQGRFDPVAGARQVIPRVAYVLNYNLVYNESRDRWEPKKKGSFQLRAFRTSTQAVPANSTEPLRFQSTSGRDGGRVSTPTTSIQVPRDGQYVVAASIILDDVPDEGSVNSFIDAGGATVAEGANADPDGAGNLNAGTVAAVDLAAGDQVSLRILNRTNSKITILGSTQTSTLAVAQL